jgi:hypothetical protein
MVVYRVPHEYLNGYQLNDQRYQVLMNAKRKDIDYQEQLELSKLLVLQEAHRLLRNYNYDKDTEFLRQYAYGESVREQRLILRASAVGLYIDRYI